MKRWKLQEAPTLQTLALQAELKIHPAICEILVHRGITTFEEARIYFRPSLEYLHNPFLMKDMEKAVSRITLAREKKEKVLLYGDYDVDGTTSVAILYRFLKNILQLENLEFYIPHRYREGYGISRMGIDYACANEFTLIIALDCGIKSIELVELANSHGIDFIICDHHLPDPVLPAAYAILNPKQPECKYPYKDLCGCGVGYKLIQAIVEYQDLDARIPQDYLDLLATAIAADIVPLTGENRILATYGLQKVNDNPSPGIKAILDKTDSKGPYTMYHLAFTISPRINAAGRMDDAKKAVQLFIEDDPSMAAEKASHLHLQNDDRKIADSNITEEALMILQKDPLNPSRNSTVVFQPHWHKGVVGIVASRLIDHYYRPTIVLTKSGDYLAGSARSVQGFNLYEAIHACREHLLGYGGHYAAAGLTLLPSNLDAFSSRFEEVVSQTITEEQKTPELLIDAEISFQEITMKFFDIINRMEPFGPDNPKPVFLTRNVYDTGRSTILKGKHLRMEMEQSQKIMTGIAFNMSDQLEIFEKGPTDIAYHIEKNEWKGNISIQLKIIAIRPSLKF